MISFSNLATDPGTMDEVRSSASWSRMLYYSISYAHVNWCKFRRFLSIEESKLLKGERKVIKPKVKPNFLEVRFLKDSN